MDDCLLLDAGSGGRASQRLVAQCFLRHFANLCWNAWMTRPCWMVCAALAMSTDSYTVTPLFFRAAASAVWPCTARSTTCPCSARGPDI
mgnify:CR=1 FL=1